MTEPDTTAGVVTPFRRVSPTVIVAAILALVLIATAALLLTLWAPSGRSTVEIVAFVTATIAPTIVGLLAILRTDHTAQQAKANARILSDATTKLDEVASNVNGHLERHEELARKVLAVSEGLARATPAAVGQTTTADQLGPADSDAPRMTAAPSTPPDADPLAAQT